MHSDELEYAAQFLRAGGVVAAATETFFGLLADGTQRAALDEVFAIKGRDAAKGMSVLLPAREAWSDLVLTLPALALELADRYWPGPLTIALDAKGSVDRRLTVDGTVAVRLPGPSVAAELTARLGVPLTATSANHPGFPPARTDREAREAFPNARTERRLLVLAGDSPGAAPSTIVRVRHDRLELIREGIIPFQELLQGSAAAGAGHFRE